MIVVAVNIHADVWISVVGEDNFKIAMALHWLTGQLARTLDHSHQIHALLWEHIINNYKY